MKTEVRRSKRSFSVLVFIVSVENIRNKTTIWTKINMRIKIQLSVNNGFR